MTLSRNVYTTEAVKFNKDRSVWKTFVEDTPDHLMKCLEQDLKFGKLSRVVKTDQDFQNLKQEIFKDYYTLKNMFVALSAVSNYPVISWNDYSLFINRSDLLDKKLNLAEVDRALISTNYTLNKYKNSAERELHRYEFIEIIARISIVKFLQTKQAESLAAAYAMIKELIIPKNAVALGMTFREEHMYNLKCDEFFRKNEPVFKRIMENFFTPNKRFLTSEDALKIVHDAKITGISDNKILVIYAESLMSRIDTLSDLSVMQQMRYVELICFVPRLAHEVYQEGKNVDAPLHLKIDMLTNQIFEAYNEQKLFSFKDEGLEDSSSSGEGEDDDSGSASDLPPM